MTNLVQFPGLGLSFELRTAGMLGSSSGSDEESPQERAKKPVRSAAESMRIFFISINGLRLNNQ